MTIVRVDTDRRWLRAFGEDIPCAIGRSGAVAAADKREGDGATPIGDWPILGALLRPDRGVQGGLALPWRWIRPADGWCDAPADPAYNQAVALPHQGSAESLCKAHEAYDTLLVLSYNRAPVVPGNGSAIFWHVARADRSAPHGLKPTAGCVAIPRPALLALLPRLRPGDRMTIGPFPGGDPQP